MAKRSKPKSTKISTSAGLGVHSPMLHAPRREGTKLGVLVGPTRYHEADSSEPRFCFDILDLDAGNDEPERIPLGFFGHGFAMHPKRTHEAALLEKRGPGACYVDLIARRVLETIAPLPGHAFYGHGAFSKEGDVLFAIEMNLSNGEGVVSIRDARTFDSIDTFPTYGAAPHDCHLIEDGKTLAITNGGGPVGSNALPCVTFVDVKSQALLEKHEVRNPNINTGHIAVGFRREFAVVSAPRSGLPEESSTGGVSLRAQGKPWVHMTDPKSLTSKMVGESLSVLLHDRTRSALATHPYGHFITLWDLDTQRLKWSMELPHPRGVTSTLDGKTFAISYGEEASLLFLDAASLKPLQGRAPGTRRFGGSHIYIWAYPA